MATTKEDYLQQIKTAGESAQSYYSDYTEANAQRDNIIRDAIKHGVSMYAIAKTLGISNAAVAKIRDNN